MTLKALVQSVLPNFPSVTPETEVEVLQELPTETLYLALKDADAELTHWLFENALPRQVQGLIDVDCWTGDAFLPERFHRFFKTIVTLSPPKIVQYMKSLDPEVITRGLMEHFEVRDFDSHEPIDLEESTFMLSPDNKYVLLLKTEDPETREVLMQWMNRYAAADLEHLRRTLETLKWEQATDLEEYGYQMKKGRLEEMGFVDYFDAVALYRRGTAAETKKHMLENALDPDTKTSIYKRNEVDGEDLDSETAVQKDFLPDVLSGPMSQDGFLSEAFRRVTDTKLREVLLMELLRTVNGALSADKLLHGELADIALGSARTRKYMDLGLAYLADNNADRAAEQVAVHRMDDIFHLGWLTVQDLVKVAKDLTDKYTIALFPEPEAKLLEGLRGRHPQIEAAMLKELHIEGDSIVRLDAILVLGLRLAQISAFAKFVDEQLSQGLGLKDQPPTAGESAPARLMTGLLRQACGRDFTWQAIGEGEWKELASAFKPEMLAKMVDLTVARAPDLAKPIVQTRLKSVADDVSFLFKNSPNKYPDRRFFKGLVLQ